MNQLTALRAEKDRLWAEFIRQLEERYPGLTQHHWYRARGAYGASPVDRRNADTSNDEALVKDEALATAHDAYLIALHAFYGARDGANGVLGSRGL